MKAPTPPPDATAGDHLGLRRDARSLSSAFPPMLVAASRIAASIAHGVHGRRRQGPGEDFWQYRHYSPGDATQHIDWHKSARSTHVFVRENEWAASNTLWVWAAADPGMSYRSHLAAASKHERAATIALALAMLAMRAGERVAIPGYPYPPDHTGRALQRMARWLAAPPDSAKQDLPPAVELNRFSSCVLLGDFLRPLDAVAARLSVLATRGVAGHIVQVLDPAEETLPFAGRTEFREFAGPRRVVIGKVETLRPSYHDRLRHHRDGLRDLARRLGWTFTVHHTDQAPGTLLLSLYTLLSGDRSTHAMQSVGA